MYITYSEAKQEIEVIKLNFVHFLQVVGYKLQYSIEEVANFCGYGK